MSYTLPNVTNSLTPVWREKKDNSFGKYKQVNEENQEQKEILLFTQQRNELEDIMKRQKERIEKIRTSVNIDIGCNEASHRAQLLTEKKELETELASLTRKLDKISFHWQEVRQLSNHEFQWGEMRFNLAQVTSRINDLKAEIKESEKQKEAAQILTDNRRERLKIVRKELQQTKENVKWLLECQTMDEQVFKNRIREEEEYLRQLIEARDNTAKEVIQLSEKEKLEVSPLQEDLDLLEKYLEEMQIKTHTMERQYEDYRYKINEVKKIAAESLEKLMLPIAYQRSLEYIDKKLINSLNEKLNLALRQHRSPLSVNTNKEEWLRNYLSVWNLICQQCNGLKQDAKQNSGVTLNKTKQKIEITQNNINEIIGIKTEEAMEKERSILVLENFIHFLYKQEKKEEEIFNNVKNCVINIGESPIPYLSLIKMEGYNDIINDEDGYDNNSNNNETLMPKESNNQNFETIPEEETELAINEMKSMTEIIPDDLKANDKFRQTAHRSRGYLNKFLQEKLLFINEQVAQTHIPLRRTVSTGPPNTIEGALSRIQEKMINDVINFVKNQKQNITQVYMNSHQETISPDPNYTTEAEEREEKLRLLLSKKQNDSYLNLNNHKGNSTQLYSNSPTFKKIIIEGARLPPEVINASSTRQAKYFLSCIIRGFTAVTIIPGTNIPTVRHIFLTRDLSYLCAREVKKKDSLELQERDFAVKLSNIQDVILPSDERIVGSKLKVELSLVLNLISEKEYGTYWVIQTDNSESKKFWSYVFAWVINESSFNNNDGIIIKLKKAKKIFVLDTAGTTPDNIEPSDRNRLFVQVDEK